VSAWPRTPIHPGEHLAEELKELGISAAELARQIKVPVNRVTGIINGQRAITADTALRLGHWFSTSPEFWLNLQKLYELRLARRRSATAWIGFRGSPIASARKSTMRLASFDSEINPDPIYFSKGARRVSDAWSVGPSPSGGLRLRRTPPYRFSLCSQRVQRPDNVNAWTLLGGRL